MVQAMLLTDGHRLQRQRVAESLIRVDEAGVAMRWAQAVQRRTYSVSGPNALWHIDGNHKLIRYFKNLHINTNNRPICHYVTMKLGR